MKGSSRERSFGSKRSGPSRPGGAGKPGNPGKSFKRSDSDPSSRPQTSRGYTKRADSSEGKATDAKRGSKSFDPRSSDEANKGMGKRSRFASSSEKNLSAARPRTTTGKRPFIRKDEDAKFPPRGKPRFSESAGDDRRKGRRESFGKPYKKTYKPRPFREGPPGRRKTEADPTAPKSDKIRLNKFIANSGISSRREADELITMGLISVNGKIISELGYKVNPGDEVRYEDKVLRAEKPVYVLMNKPKGFLTTTDDPQERKTVMHIIGSAVKERIYPVGRLDRNTTGLLLLTNDGDLADKLMHPSFNVKKVYKVELDKPLAKNDFQAIIDGVRLEEGKATVDDLAIVSDDGRTVGIELHIGWNRVVRRIFESLGYEVIKLDRSVYAGLDKKELGRGQWRFLTKEEIIHLKHFK
jgi:23S rRNA pseudouridine2605 synthase